MKNTLGDLNNHLFAQLERLNDEDIQGVQLEEEINRAKAITSIASKIIDTGSLVLDAEKFKDNKMDVGKETPRMLQGGE